MKKSQLIEIIKEELQKLLSERRPLTTFGSEHKEILKDFDTKVQALGYQHKGKGGNYKTDEWTWTKPGKDKSGRPVLKYVKYVEGFEDSDIIPPTADVVASD